MTKTLIAGMLALSLAFTGFASAPARANDTARLLAGLATLFIITKVIEDNHRHHHYARTYAPAPRHHFRLRTARRSRALPARCLARTWTRNGWVKYYRRGCLRRFGARRWYPEACRTSVWTPRGWRTGYKAYCLERRGFRAAWNN